MKMMRNLFLLLFLFAYPSWAFQSAHQRAPISKKLVPKQLPLVSRSVLFKDRATRLAADDGSSSSESTAEAPRLDTDALVKYVAAGTVQMNLFAGIFMLLDFAVKSMGNIETLPFPLVAFFFYVCSLKSRILNPLDNARPQLKEAATTGKPQSDRVLPSWTPPGVVFPIMWILIIGPLRAYSSALVYEANGMFFHPATLAFVFHLTIGDIWNTINNVERRYGASVPVVLCVVASAALAAKKYYEVVPLAGKLLGVTLLWLVTATTLIVGTWRLNPAPSGEMDPLYPAVGDAGTKIKWFPSNTKGK